MQDSCTSHLKIQKIHVMNDKDLTDIQSKWVFVNAMVHLPTFVHHQASIHQLHHLTLHSDIEGDLHMFHMFIHKINVACSECTVVLQANNVCECKADKGMTFYSSISCCMTASVMW